MTLLLMAAGSGSRYGKLKQFDELGPKAEFLLEFSIYDAIKSGFDHIVLVTKKENQSFLSNYLTQRIPSDIKIDVVVQDINDLPKNTAINTERIKPWGTAHAVWSARKVVKSSFVIINADDYYGNAGLWWVIAWFNKKPMDTEVSLGDLIMIPLPIEKILAFYDY